MTQSATLIKSKEGYVKPEAGQVAVYWSPLDYTDIFDAVGSDVLEWVDLLLLAFDGAMRAGHSPQKIVMGICEKQLRNESRMWPDYRNYAKDEAIQHIKDQPIDCFKIGLIVRHGVGSTALMRVDAISLNHCRTGEHRYYGRHCMGGLQACYSSDAILADSNDLLTWRKCVC